MLTRPHAAHLFFAVVVATALAGSADGARAAAVGAQLGADRSGIEGDSPPNTGYSDLYGVVAGLQGEFGVARALSLSLQPSFVQKKSRVRIAPSGGADTETERDLAFDYVSVPLVVKFAKAGGRTYVSGGVTIDFLTSATLSGEGADRDVTSAYKSSGVGAVLGFGVVFPAGRSHLTTELRYVQGITNMNGGGVAEATGALAPRLHSAGFELIIGGLIPIGGR